MSSITNPSPIDEPIQLACESDEFGKIADIINGDIDILYKVIDCLDKAGNLSMKLRVMSMPIIDQDILVSCLMSLDPSDADKINRLCKDGLNPALHFSAHKGMELYIRLIAHLHANLDVVGQNGMTPLIMACETSNSDMVKMLINNGARSFNKGDKGGWTPLHFACQLGNPEIVDTLIRAGADVNALSSDGFMPIHVGISTAQAALSSNTAPNGIPWSTKEALQCIYLLANNGADLEYVCSYNYNAMGFLKKIGAIK